MFSLGGGAHGPGSVHRQVWGLRAAVVLVVVLTTCEPSRRGGSVVIGVRADANALLPVLQTGGLDAEIGDLLYRGLNSVRWENGTLRYVIDELSLSERWEFGPDSTTLTYTLRPDAVWSDGRPITAEDVVFTYELVRRAEIGSPFIDFWENLDSVAAEDARRVTFHFRRRYPGMLFHTGIGIIPAHVFAPASGDRASLTGHPALRSPGGGTLVVSGPFQVAEWRRGERLVLVANPRAFTPGPRVDRVIFRVIPDEATRLLELQNGALDAVHPAPLVRAKELSADPRFRVETVPGRYFDYIAWHAKGFPPFGDPEIRRALSLAIDRKAMLAGLGIERYATPAAGPYPPIFRDLADPDVTADPYLPDSARAILAGKGWRDRDGDGVLDRGARPFRFTLLIDAANERRSSAAQILQAQYRAVGIDLRIRGIEFNTLLDLIFEARDYEAALLGWQVALQPDYVAEFFGDPKNPYNVTGYSSAAVDSLIGLARAAATETEGAPYWREAAGSIARDRPYAFLWFFDEVVALSERVRGARIDTYGVFQNLHEWTLVR